MRVGVVSDSHDQLAGIDRVVKRFTELRAELVVHCGDWVGPFTLKLFKQLPCPLYGVYGNNDGDPERHAARRHEMGLKAWRVESPALEFDLDGKPAVVYHHLDLLPPEWKARVQKTKYRYVFSGHTHEPDIHEENGVLFVNPGTLIDDRPWGGEWRPTAAFLDTSTGKAELLEV